MLTSSRRRAAAAGFWTLGSEAGGKLAMLATSLIVARSLTPTEFGVYVAFVALGVVSGLMWDAGLSTLALREVGAGTMTSRGALAQGSRLRLGLLLIWLVLTLVASVIVTGGVIQAGSVAPVLLGSAAIAFHSLAIASGRGNGQFRAMGLTLVVGRVVGLAGTVPWSSS